MVGGSTATNHFCHNHQPKMSIIPENPIYGYTSYSKINSGLAEIESSILKLENTGEDHSLSRHRPRRLVDRIFGREEQC